MYVLNLGENIANDPSGSIKIEVDVSGNMNAAFRMGMEGERMLLLAANCKTSKLL